MPSKLRAFAHFFYRNILRWGFWYTYLVEAKFTM